MGQFEFLDPGRLQDSDLELVLARTYEANPALGYSPAYVFDMRLTDRDEPIGRIELRVGSTRRLIMYAGHIGYRVFPEHRGHRYAARACRLILPLARRHDLKTLWITCDPENHASRRTCELAGAELVEIVEVPEQTDMYRRGERLKCRYRLRVD